MQTANLYEQYKSQTIQTLTKGEVVVKLFEEASKQVSLAIFLKNQNNSVGSFNCIAKAQKIITTLNHSLDMNYAISLELNDMYRFLLDKLNEANATGDVELMKQLLNIINELKITFKQADRLARTRSLK
jgi:flagellar protein FliS